MECQDNPDDLIELSQHIHSSLRDSAKGIEILHSYFQKRQELEEQFANELSIFLQTPSSSFSLIYDEINCIFNYHRDIANEMKTQFIPPIEQFKNFIKKEEENLSKDITITDDLIKKYQKKVFNAKSQFEKAQIQSLHFSTSKIDKSKRIERNYKKELSYVESEKNRYISNLRNKTFPDFFSNMGEIDFSIRTTIKNSMLNLSHFEIYSTQNLLQSLSTVNLSANRYEPSIDTQTITKLFGLPTLNKRLYGIAKAEFDGEDINDLSFSRGDFIEVLKQHPSGWWEGECYGRRGLFPMNFVDLLTDIESGAITINEVFEIDNDYNPKQDNELFLEFGDVVYVSTLKDGWCQGYKIGTNKVGKFPANIVKNVKRIQIK